MTTESKRRNCGWSWNWNSHPPIQTSSPGFYPSEAIHLGKDGGPHEPVSRNSPTSSLPLHLCSHLSVWPVEAGICLSQEKLGLGPVCQWSCSKSKGIGPCARGWQCQQRRGPGEFQRLLRRASAHQPLSLSQPHMGTCFIETRV